MPDLHSLLLSVLLLLATIPSVADSSRPNIVFVLSDNQSYYEMGCHGHAQLKTPHIDKLASQSVEFRKFYAPPFCSPSRSVILTGQYAMRSGVFTTIGGRSILHKDKTTLPEILKKQGYHTGIFGKWHLGFSYPYRPEDRGFDEVFVHGGGGVGQLEDYYGNTLFDTTFIHNGRVSPSEGYCTDALFDRAISYIEAHRDERFFCYLPTPVTHSPHRGPKDLVAQLKAKGIGRNAELFAQVQNLDANIGRLMKALESTGLVKNTILIYASDQGMNDRGSPQGGNRLGLGFDPAHHVPFMIRVPGAKPAVSTRLAGMIDLFPTLLDFCGVERPKDCDGLSLRPLIQATTGYPVDRTLIIQCPRSRTAVKWKNASVKTDRWRLVDGTMLYDAQKDPRQTTDVAADHPKVVAALRAKYERFWSDLPEPETTWSRHILGAKECQSVTLNAMDWYRGARPWNSRDYQRAGNGAWPVTIARDGRYRFECRRFPREAKKAAEATHAKIRIGESTAETEISADATKATFELDLKAGEYDLETWLTVGGKARGALWVYVKQLSSRS